MPGAEGTLLVHIDRSNLGLGAASAPNQLYIQHQSQQEGSNGPHEHGIVSLPRVTPISSPSAFLGRGSSPGAGHAPDTASSSTSTKAVAWRHVVSRASSIVVSNFMLLSFSFAAALAMAWPLPGRVVASWSVGDVRVVQAINNFLVFLISGLTLKSDDFRCVLAAELVERDFRYSTLSSRAWLCWPCCCGCVVNSAPHTGSPHISNCLS